LSAIYSLKNFLELCLEKGKDPLTTNAQEELRLKSLSLYFFKMVNLLLHQGANVNSADKRERRAIHWAAYHGKNNFA
jgi:ankyrin repeat protein